jgi:DNA-directed RNA polymerase subunit RPC12/RpoP
MKNCPNCKQEVSDEFHMCWNCSYDFLTKKVSGFIKNESSSAKREINCLRCSAEMTFKRNAAFQHTKIEGVDEDLHPMFNSDNNFDIYNCPKCGKLEFFTS